MAVFKLSLVLVGLFVLGTVGAAAMVPLIDSSCRGSFTDLHPERSTGKVVGASLEAAGRGGTCDSTPHPCPAGEVVRKSSESGEPTAVVRFEVHNQQRPVEARFCLSDQDGIKRIDVTRKIMTGSTLVLDLEVPPDVYNGGFQVEGDRLLVTYHRIDPSTCPQDAIVLPASIAIKFFGGVSGQGGQADCLERPAKESDDAPDAMGRPIDEPPLVGPPATETMQASAVILAVASGGALAFVALLRSDRSRWMVACLFTRIRSPKALDHRLRNEIQKLVQERPGLRAEDVRKALVLGHGQTAHHLRVLVQSRVLETLRIAGSRHLYPAGRYGSEEKRRRALLNNDAARRLYQTIRQAGEGDVSTMAKRSSISGAYASRLAARLAAEGLVARRREGNRVVLSPGRGIEGEAQG